MSDANDLALGNTTAVNLTVNSGGALTQNSDSRVAVSGSTTVAAGGSVALTNATNNFGTLAVSAPNQTVGLTDADALVLGSTTAANLTINAGGAITQTAAISVSGASAITATGNGDITLINSANDFNSLSLRANSDNGNDNF